MAPAGFIEPRARVIADGFITAGVRLLGQVTHGGARMEEAFAGIRLYQPCGDLHQRRLAGAVAPHQGDARPLAHLQRGVLEQRVAADLQADVRQG